MHAAKLVLQSGDNHALLESVHDNVFWAGAAARISVVIPTFRYDASVLVDTLARCPSSALAEIVVYDDGSGDHDLLAQMQAAAGGVRAAVRIVSHQQDRGRAAACNAAIAHARADWILLLDPDMSPDGGQFIETYLNAMDRLEEPAVIVGGHSLKWAPRDRIYALHRWQAQTSECAPASERTEASGRLVFSSNVLAHREVLAACPFDDGFAGWGWEGADWSLGVQSRFPVFHIDNTATLLGLDAAKTLMAKYARAGASFARMAARHPAEVASMPLYRAAKMARRLPFRRFLKALAGGVAASPLVPVVLRGGALNAWRAFVYAEALG